MKNKINTLIFIFCQILVSQNTIGTLINQPDSFNGYTLFSPINSTETYLINNCGEVINKWSSAFSPGASAYLLENGNLLRTGKLANNSFSFGGIGGKIELFDWDNNLIWEYTLSNSNTTLHHDIHPLNNGNILVIAVTKMNLTEVIQAGRDPSLIEDNEILNEQILEIQPIGINQANIVWEWNIKDHLIQDFDNTKDNFGVISDNSQLLDFNFLNNANPIANWLHFNSIDYNETLDQIILSSRILSEIYIIDHSTTTLEAANHSGGVYGKGGDFLFRWGNPEAYNKGDSSNRTLYSQHSPHWIESGLNDAGKILLFNNGNSIGYSTTDILEPVTTSPGVYSYDSTLGYLPIEAEWEYTASTPSDFFSAIMSNAQRLPNGNTLICDGDSGYFFEIDSNENIVWEYINPDTSNGILNQGDSPNLNTVFRALKFPIDFPAFIGRDLTPGEPIEINPDLTNCEILDVIENDNNFTGIKIYPNPVVDILTINYKEDINFIEIYTIYGKLVETIKDSNTIDLKQYAAGIYILNIITGEGIETKKIVKQ